jgi:hypothetical protein
MDPSHRAGTQDEEDYEAWRAELVKDVSERVRTDLLANLKKDAGRWLARLIVFGVGRFFAYICLWEIGKYFGPRAFEILKAVFLG